MFSDYTSLGRFLQLAAGATVAACLALAVGGWVLLSALNARWVELVDTTDDGLERVDSLLTASAELAGETALGLESVDGVVATGTDVTDQSVAVVASVQEVMLPLIDNVDQFAASLEDLARFVEGNDALALLGLEPSLDSDELAVLRSDLDRLRADIEALGLDEDLAAEVGGVSDGLDSVVTELRATESELQASADRVAVARSDLADLRGDVAPASRWGKGLLIVFLTPLALTNVALLALGRRLQHGLDLPVGASPAIADEQRIGPVYP